MLLKRSTVFFLFFLFFLPSCGRKRQNPFDPQSPNYIPPIPQHFKVKGGDKCIQLSWNPVDILGTRYNIYYNVYRSLSSGKNYIKIASTPESRYQDIKVENGINYYYRVTSLYYGKESAYSQEKAASPYTKVEGNTIIWKKYSNNPVLSRSDFNDYAFDTQDILSATVVKVEEKYVMWYAGSRKEKDINNDEIIDNPFRIGRAWSKDGINWQKDPNGKAVLDIDKEKNKWDSHGVFFPVVILDDKIYRMWYTGWNKFTKKYSIGYAWSKDGINWEKSIYNPILEGKKDTWNEAYVFAPCVFYDKENNCYHMWFAGAYKSPFGFEVMIGYAKSQNPEMDWYESPFSPVMETGEKDTWDEFIITPATVIKKLDLFEMWYSGSDGKNVQIGYAASKDGINWCKKPDAVVKFDPSNLWESKDVLNPSVIKEGNCYKMWYTGASSLEQNEDDFSSVGNGIGYAIGWIE